MTNTLVADLAARLSLEAFDAFDAEFRTITRRGSKRFEEKDWQGGLRDAAERLDLYEKTLDHISVRLESDFGSEAKSEPMWMSAKEYFAALIAERYDIQRAETFFNSVTRKVLGTVGINRNVEFFYLHPEPPIPDPGDAVYRTYGVTSDTASTVRNILQDFSFRTGYEDTGRDAALLAQEIDLYTWPLVGIDGSYTIDVVKAVFYRNKEAYIVGRIVTGTQVMPMIIPLAHGESGIYADTILLRESDASIVFGFAYSYFFVDVERYDALIEFLRSIIPSADLAELHTSLGYNRHGKTLFYRELHRFVHVSQEQFIVAPGIEGAVMIAFTLPNYGFVLKVIKDRPCFLRSMNQPPKMATMEHVRLRYDFVSHRDRAGRMVDTQEFENLRFRKRRFSDSLLREFEQAATRNVTVTDEHVIMRYVYVQRKVAPLPLYFTDEKNPETLRRVLIDFGYFLKDIAASGIFPGDLFNTWNYGVTLWGRVVLYDYDDVLPMEDVTFREKPLPRNGLEETLPEEDWICVTGEDFFMDEMERYSGIPQPLRGVFKSVHGDLYTLAFWKTLTEKLNKGEIFDVIPYDRTMRFRDSGRSTPNTASSVITGTGPQTL